MYIRTRLMIGTKIVENHNIMCYIEDETSATE